MTNHIKYPKTYHLSWSPGISLRDKVMSTTKHLHDKRVVVTEKMDGENTSIYYNGCHARSIDSADHVSRHHVKAVQGQIAHLMAENPNRWITGENMFAKHSIRYYELEDLFLVFGSWMRSEEDGTIWCDHWNITKRYREPDQQEGYVVRLYEGFKLENWSKYVGKFVRKNHVQTSEHWLNEPMVKNTVKEQE